MIDCRSVSPETWEHARDALVFYFSRRHGLAGAEDLAQETLATILSRKDYLFEKEEDFLKVCYGFAAHILQAARREGLRRARSFADNEPPPFRKEAAGLVDRELTIYVREVLELARSNLGGAEWLLIEETLSMVEGCQTQAKDPAEANRGRVKLHRARRKLARLVGWRKD